MRDYSEKRYGKQDPREFHCERIRSPENPGATNPTIGSANMNPATITPAATTMHALIMQLTDLNAASRPLRFRSVKTGINVVVTAGLTQRA